MKPKAPLANCEDCPLRDQPHVLGRGPDNPRVLIIGEAPGYQETHSGIPFTGKSGQLLNRVLKHHGIERDEVYVTNTVLCRPQDAEGKNRQPTAKEINHCKLRLAKEVQDRKPSVVLTLGAVAAKTALQSREGIKALRVGGSKFSDYLGTNVIATFHPAAALRNPELFPSIVSDVKKITEPVGIGWEATKYVVAKDVKEATDLLIDRATHALNSTIVLDIETKPDENGIYDRHHPDFLCIGISHRPGEAVVFPKEVVDNPQFRYSLSTFLHDHRFKWMMQNGKFDIQHLWEFAPDARVDEDTLLMHYATDERKGTHDLEQLATEILGAPFYKTETKAGVGDDDDLSNLPTEVLHQYNAMDCDVTYRLQEPLYKEMESDGTLGVYREFLIPGQNAVASIEFEGICFDTDYMSKVYEELHVEELEAEAATQAWVDNPRSPQQVKKALMELGYEVASTNKDILKTIDHEFVYKLLAYRKVQKLISTYVKGLSKHVEADGRIHANFNMQGTETGRLSSSEPNLQNIPIGSQIRQGFIASGPDRVILNMDYSGIELRLAALLSQDPYLTAVFKEGRSLHKEVAVDQFGPNYTGRQYRDTKSVNFSIIYDASPKTMFLKYGVPLKIAKQMVDAWQKRSPRLFNEYRRDIEEQILTQGYLRSHFGRMRRFWLVTYDNKHEVFREGYNFPIQSMASDITLRSLIKLTKLLRGSDVKIIGTVHDSLMFDAPKENIEDTVQTIKAVMEDCEFEVPIEVEAKWHYRWEGSDE